MSLSHNAFTSTPSLSNTVTWLDLSWNKLTIVDENVSQLAVLQHLDLRHNRLTSRSLPDLSDLSFLEYLDVSENSLTTWPRLAGGAPLRTLKMSYNTQLGDPHDDFGPFPSLEHMSCSYTVLKYFPKFLMSATENLNFLDLSHTLISRLPMSLHFPRLLTFNISATKILPSSESSVEIHDPKWSPPESISDEVQASLRGLSYLHSATEIHMSGIGLFHLPSSLFEIMSQHHETLKRAATEPSPSPIDSNEPSKDATQDCKPEDEGEEPSLDTAPLPLPQKPAVEVPLPAAQLTRLYLRWNNLFSLPDALFNLVSLECLDLLGNKLEQLSPQIARLTNLRHLSLGHNRLMILPIEITQLTRLESLILEHNVWEDAALESLCWATDGVEHIFERLKSQSREPIVIPRRKSIPELPGTPEEQLRDRVFGLVFGLALGDSVGLCSEFMTHTQATYSCDSFNIDPLRMHRDRHRTRWLEGDWTDDTDQAILLMETLLANPPGTSLFNINLFAHSLLQWAENGFPELGDDGGMGIGNTVAQVLHHPAYLENPKFAAYDVWKNSGCNVAANGALMRCAPLALFGFWEDFDETKNAERQSIIAQREASYAEDTERRLKERDEANQKENAKAFSTPKKKASKDSSPSETSNPSKTTSSSSPATESKPSSSKSKKGKISNTTPSSSSPSTELSTSPSIPIPAIGDSVSSLGRHAPLVRQHTLDSCHVTHADPRCLASCLALNMAIVAILRGERDVETILEIACAEGTQAFAIPAAEGSLHTAMYADWRKELKSLIFEQQLDRLDLSDASRMGYTFKGLGAAFACFRNSVNFERSIVKITQCGGDADTNGAIAGALLGATVGYRQLPKKWLSALPHFDWLNSLTDKVWDHVKSNMFPTIDLASQSEAEKSDE